MPTAEPGARVLTVPNLLTFGRLASLPTFVSLLRLGDRRSRSRAAWVLAALGASDGLDGWVARRYDQGSELGKVADPLVDRVLVATAIVGAMRAGVVPRWFVRLVAAREVCAAGGAAVLAASGRRRVEVSRTGKAGAFAMMVALPLFILAGPPSEDRRAMRAAAWFIGGAGQVLAWSALAGYLRSPGGRPGPDGADMGASAPAPGQPDGAPPRGEPAGR